MSTGWSSEWLDFAYMDLSAAEHLLTMRPLPVEIICYHCEQAAEKFLKATLVQFDREPPKTHDLIQLCKLCCEVDTRFEQLADSCIELTPYGVQVRYPSNLELDESDAVCALKECRLVQDFVCQNTEQEQAEAMKRYIREVFIPEYAKNFNKELFASDIKFYPDRS